MKRIKAGLYSTIIDGMEIWVELHSVDEGYDHNWWSWNLPGDYPSDSQATKRDAIAALEEARKIPFIWDDVKRKHDFFKMGE